MILIPLIYVVYYLLLRFHLSLYTKSGGILIMV